MENTVIQHTFFKFYQNKKNTIFNKKKTDKTKKQV